MAKANFEDYNNGAITALSYAAQSGAPLKNIVDAMQAMGVMIDSNTDESDRDRFIEAFEVDALKAAGDGSICASSCCHGIRSFIRPRKSSLRVLRRLLVNSVSAKDSWFMVGINRSQIKSARLSHVVDLIACSLSFYKTTYSCFFVPF